MMLMDLPIAGYRQVLLLKVLNHRPFKPVFTGLNRFKRSMCLGVKTGKNPNKKK